MHAALETLGIHKRYLRRMGSPSSPRQYVFRAYPVDEWPDPKLLTAHLRKNIKKAIKLEGLEAIIVVTVSPRYSWAVSEF